MNINELSAHVHNNQFSQSHNSNHVHNHFASHEHVSSLSHVKAQRNVENATTTTSEKFEDILSSFTMSDNTEELSSKISELQKSLDVKNSENTDSVDKSDVMNILNDATLAKEYLENKTGRNLIVSMAQNQIAGIVSGSNS